MEDFISFYKRGCKLRRLQWGGKQRKPFTGFEGLSYDYEAPNHSLQGRSQRPEIETIKSNGNLLQSRETWYDPEEYHDTGKLKIDDQTIYSGNGDENWEPTDQQQRVFDSLKRHAIMNQQLERNSNRKISWYKCGSKLKKKIGKGQGGLKTPYRSELGYTQDRGGGTQYVHRVYPEDDSYYIDVQYNKEALYPDRQKRFIYNPTNSEFDYDSYDYSNTTPAKRYSLKYNEETGKYDKVENGVYDFSSKLGDQNESATPFQVLQYLQNLKMPLVPPSIRNGKLRGYEGGRIYK